MPINAGPEYFAAEKKYLEARTKEEKIRCLEEMIRTVPHHKGSENLLAQFRKRLAKLKSEKDRSTYHKTQAIKREGAAQVCIIGLTNSGKSTLLNMLTNASTRLADHPYTTKKPTVGMMDYNDVQVQMIEIPSFFDADSMNILRSCDFIVVILDPRRNLAEQKLLLRDTLSRSSLENRKHVYISSGEIKNNSELNALKKIIWENLNLIRVYTKSPCKERAVPAVALPKNSTLKDLAEEIHKDFIKTFKFARVFNSTRFSGMKVGLEYKLKDSDVIEIHTD